MCVTSFLHQPINMMVMVDWQNIWKKLQYVFIKSFVWLIYQFLVDSCDWFTHMDQFQYCMGCITIALIPMEQYKKGMAKWLTWNSWWLHQMETFFALLAICAGNSPITGEFRAQWPVTLSFDIFFDLCLNERLSKQSWGWWFETTLHPLWCHCNVIRCHYATKTKQNKTKLCAYFMDYSDVVKMMFNHT